MTQPTNLLEDTVQYNAGLLAYYKGDDIKYNLQNQAYKDGVYFARIMDILIRRNIRK